jgi:phage tail sheath protein FI
MSGDIHADGVKTVQLSMISHCEQMRDRMAILDPLPELTTMAVREWRLEHAGYDTHCAALYYPWLSVLDPVGGAPLSIPPSGHMAGVWCRTDLLRGAHMSPANELVRGVLEPAMYVTRGEHDVLNPIGVNVIRHAPGRGVRVWGARTLSFDPAYRYIFQRRLLNFIEQTIARSTDWAVFERHDDRSLWQQLVYDISDLLSLMWRAGALSGGSPREAFVVRCDDELNSADTLNLNRLYVDVSVAVGAGLRQPIRVVYVS